MDTLPRPLERNGDDHMKKLFTMILLVPFMIGAKAPNYEGIPDNVVKQVLSQQGWHSVEATREGLVGETTASGYLIKESSIFVALPSRKALGRWVAVRYKNKVMVCKVRDVGPHSIYDPYWESGDKPAAEKGIRLPRKWGESKNGAGIDLSNGLWDWLHIKRGKGIAPVKWKFIKR